MVEPLLVNYYDNGSATLYNLTEEQFDKICEEDDPSSLLDKFEIKVKGFENGYAPDFMHDLAKMYGFEVRSE